jgi:hypothetical protein
LQKGHRQNRRKGFAQRNRKSGVEPPHSKVSLSPMRDLRGKKKKLPPAVIRSC